VKNFEISFSDLRVVFVFIGFRGCRTYKPLIIEKRTVALKNETGKCISWINEKEKIGTFEEARVSVVKPY